MKNLLFLIFCFLPYTIYSQDCDSYLKKSDSILRNDGWANSSKVLPYYNWYYACIEKNKLAEPRINNLKQYQSFTLSANRKGGFAKKQNGEIGIIDDNYNYIKTLPYESYYAFIGNTAIVKNKKNSWRGYNMIDYKGNVFGNDGFDFINFKGNILTTAKGWDRASAGDFGISYRGLIKFECIKKDTLVSLGYNDSVFDKNEDYFVANKNLFDFKGNVVDKLSDFQNYEVYQLTNGMIKLEFRQKFGYIEFPDLKQTIPFIYNKADDFSENLASVCINHKCGFINKQGKEVIPLIYDDNRAFSNGLALVKINNKFGFIDNQGNMVIPAKYSYAKSFEGGKAQVEFRNSYFYIDTAGKCIENCKQ